MDCGSDLKNVATTNHQWNCLKMWMEGVYVVEDLWWSWLWSWPWISTHGLKCHICIMFYFLINHYNEINKKFALSPNKNKTHVFLSTYSVNIPSQFQF